MFTESILLRQMMHSSEHRNENSGFIKYGQFIFQLRKELLTSQKALCLVYMFRSKLRKYGRLNMLHEWKRIELHP
jgi:hypothetical protein